MSSTAPSVASVRQRDFFFPVVIGQFLLAWVRWSPWRLHTAPGLF